MENISRLNSFDKTRNWYSKHLFCFHLNEWKIITINFSSSFTERIRDKLSLTTEQLKLARSNLHTYLLFASVLCPFPYWMVLFVRFWFDLYDAVEIVAHHWINIDYVADSCCRWRHYLFVLWNPLSTKESFQVTKSGSHRFRKTIAIKLASPHLLFTRFVPTILNSMNLNAISASVRPNPNSIDDSLHVQCTFSFCRVWLCDIGISPSEIDENVIMSPEMKWKNHFELTENSILPFVKRYQFILCSCTSPLELRFFAIIQLDECMFMCAQISLRMDYGP